jgi:DNA-binding GntR family transcriptional regulator
MATYSQVNARLQALRFRSNQNEETWREAVKEHEQMVAALSARDPAAMRAVMTQHLPHKLGTVIQQLREAGAAAQSPSKA